MKNVAFKGLIFAHFMLTNASENLTDKLFDALNDPQSTVRQIAALLEHGAHVNTLPLHRAQPLHYAIKKGRADIVALLIHNGANVNAYNIAYHTPLDCALHTKDAKIVRLLLEHGATEGRPGHPPLCFATQNGLANIVRLLLEYSIGLNDKDYSHQTALDYAIEEGKVEIARLLIEHGAEINMKDSEGKTPLHKALEDRKIAFGEEIFIHIIRTLNPNVPPPLNVHLKKITDQKSVIAYDLIKHNADINAQDYDGNTPLHTAVLWKKIKIVRLLLNPRNKFRKEASSH